MSIVDSPSSPITTHTHTHAHTLATTFLHTHKHLPPFRSDACTSSRRGDLEDFVGEQLDDFVGQMEVPILLSLLATVGAYALSSNDKAGGAYQYNQPAKKMPKPRPWCYTALQQLDVDHACNLNLKELLGTNYNWAVVGLVEACERVSVESAYDWLRVAPFLEVNHKKVTIARDQTQKKREQSFEAVQVQVREMAVRAAVLEQEQREAIVAVAVAEKKEPPKDTRFKTSTSWLRNLVRYAPNINILSSLLAGDLAPYAVDLMDELCTRVQDFYWVTAAQVDTLSLLLEQVPLFKSPRMATALLKNESADDLTDTVLDFIARCLAEYNPDRGLAAGGETKGEGKEGETKQMSEYVWESIHVIE